MHIYRYTAQRYVRSFLYGRLRFMPLSYYQGIERAGLRDPRGDGREGSHHLFLESAARSTGPDTSQPVRDFDLAITTWIPADRVYVLCFSITRSAELSAKFAPTPPDSSACIEVTSVAALAQGLRQGLKRCGLRGSYTLLHGPVNYYSTADRSIGPFRDQPEVIAFLKTDQFSGEHEYRFVLIPNGLERTTDLVTLGTAPQGHFPNAATAVPPPLTIRVARRPSYLRECEVDVDREAG